MSFGPWFWLQESIRNLSPFVKLSLSDDCKNVNNDRLWPNNTLADVNMV